MLDVHPPHEAAHTWRDFLIHIATIVVGLLIAVGLEQTVEAIHHHRERTQLREDLIAEANNNLELMRLDYQYFDRTLPRIEALRSQLDSFRAHPASGPQLANTSPVSNDCDCFFPDSPVWNTAKESDAVALLPRREAAFYDLVYAQNALMTTEFHAYHLDLFALSNFSLRFVQDPTQQPDLTRMSPEDLREYTILLANLHGELSRFREMTDYARSVNQLAAQGNTNDQTGFQQIGVSKRH